MTDRPGNDNDKEKVSRLTMSDLNRHWDDMLSGFRGAGAGSDDIEIHSFEDLGLDEHGIDLSSGDADPASSGPSSRPAAVSRAQLREAQYPVSDLAGTREFQRIETNEPETDHHTAPKTPAPAAQEPRAAEPAPAPEPEPDRRLPRNRQLTYSQRTKL